MNNKVAIYARVSTEKTSQTTSFDLQQELFNKIAKDNNEQIVEVYADRESGTKLDNRENYERMIKDAGVDIVKYVHLGKTITNYVASNREPKFYKIYIKSTSRFARNTLSKQIINELKRKNVSIYFMEQNINTSEPKTFMLDLYMIFDEQESRDKSLKMRASVQKSYENNDIRCNGKLYGYRYHGFVKNDRQGEYSNRLEAIPEEAKVVKLIFDLYEAGYGIRAIVKELAKREIKTREGLPFSKSSIGRILDNEKYCGLNIGGKWNSGEVFNKHSPKKNKTYQVKENNRIEPIISVEQFNRCKTIRMRNTENKRGKNNNQSMFYQRIRCQECEANYNADTYDGIKVYRCPTRKFKGLDECSNKYIKEDDCIKFVKDKNNKEAIINAINNEIKKLQEYINKHAYAESAIKEDIQTSLLEAIKQTIKDEIEECKKDIVAAFTRLRSKTITQEEHDCIVEISKKKILECTKEINDIDEDNKNIQEKIEETKCNIDLLKNIRSKIIRDHSTIEKRMHILVTNGKLSIDIERTIKHLKQYAL